MFDAALSVRPRLSSSVGACSFDVGVVGLPVFYFGLVLLRPGFLLTSWVLFLTGLAEFPRVGFTLAHTRIDCLFQSGDALHQCRPLPCCDRSSHNMFVGVRPRCYLLIGLEFVFAIPFPVCCFGCRRLCSFCRRWLSVFCWRNRWSLR